MSKPTRPIRLALLAAMPVAVAFYAIWYWFSTHSQLAAWYKKLHPFFYKAETWESTFFTQSVKMQGNYWCAAAVLAALVWGWLLWKTPVPIVTKPVFRKKSLLVYGFIATVGAVLFFVTHQRSEYSVDEVFSAMNYAAIPTFQTLSHYALPNNHLLFNVLNGALFFWCDDLVLTGRLISGGCYVAVLCFTWHFLKKWMPSKWVRASMLLAVALQFPVWGFSAQARGYELVLLCSCGSLGTFCAYFDTKAQHLLPLHTALNVAGLLTLPTYVYWWGGLMLAFFVLQCLERRVDKLYLRYSIIGLAAGFLTYLPLLTFSGLASLTENRYVKPGETSTWHFLTHLNELGYFNGLLSEWLCCDGFRFLVGPACLLLPILLFVYPRNDPQRRVLGIVYYSMITAFMLVSVSMLKFPFYRNLIAQGYLVLLVLLIAVSPLFRSKAKQIGFALVLTIGAGYAAFHNYKRMPDNLYYYEVGAYYRKVSDIKTDFRPASTVYVDTECFYWWHLLRSKFPEKKLKIEWNRPRFNGQDYCIMPLDSLPPIDAGLYELIEKGSQQQVFEKK